MSPVGWARVSAWAEGNLFWHKHYHSRLEAALVLYRSALRLAEVSKTVQLAVASKGGEYDLREYISLMIPYVRNLWVDKEVEEHAALKDWTSQGMLEIKPEAVVTYEAAAREKQGPTATNLANLLGGKKK